MVAGGAVISVLSDSSPLRKSNQKLDLSSLLTVYNGQVFDDRVFEQYTLSNKGALNVEAG